MTADELIRLPELHCRYELVRGELRSHPFGGEEHGRLSTALITSLYGHVKANHLGHAVQCCGFVLEQNPDTVRAPDVAFIRGEPAVDANDYVVGPPAVAFEVLQPDDTWTEARVRDCLQHGAGAVGIVIPKQRVVRVEHGDGRVEIITDTLALDDLVPGWRLPLAELFDDD